MKTLLFCLLPALLLAQVEISYSIDTAGVLPDTFFLVETVKRAVPGSPRPQVTTSALLFRDTAEFRVYIEKMQTDRAALEARQAELKTRLTLLDSRIVVLSNILTGMNRRRAPEPTVAAPGVPAKQPKKKKKQ